jgi:hypothetical protein
MPRPKGKSNGVATADKGESVAGYFRPIFLENRKLLKTRSNKALLDKWLEDHPGYTEVPENVKTGLANLKSVLRKKLRRRGRRPASETGGETTTAVARKAPRMLSKNAADRGLEKLEMMIDECMMLAVSLDREGLDDVIRILRSARNAVVWKLGGGDS